MTYSGKVVLFAVFFLLVSLVTEAFGFGFMDYYDDDDFGGSSWIWPDGTIPKRGPKQRPSKKQGPPPAAPVQSKQKANKRSKKPKRAAPAKLALQVERQDQDQEQEGPGSTPVQNLPNTPSDAKKDVPIARDVAPVERQQDEQVEIKVPDICDFMDCKKNNGAKLKMGNGNSSSSSSSAAAAGFDDDEYEDEEEGNNNSIDEEGEDDDEPNSWVSSSSSDFGEAYAESSSGNNKVKCNSGQQSGEDNCRKEMKY